MTISFAPICRALAAATTLILTAGALSAQTAAEIFGPDVYWNATPNDINNLLKGMKEFTGADFRMDIRQLHEIDTDPARNPVLFRTGHYRFAFTVEERRRLREYMLRGGMMIFNTGLGSMPFYRSVTNELAAIFPEQPLQRLTADHPIFHSFYEVDRVEYTPAVRAAGYRGDAPWFDGVEINCRVVAVVSRWGMAVGWQGEVQDDQQAYRAESAFKLGVNLLTYATSMRAWAQNSAQVMRFVDKADRAASDRLMIGQIVYDGVWKTRHAALSMLLQSFNQRTGVPVTFGLRELRLTDEALFDTPVVYLVGHEHFDLSEEEILALRMYLETGGLLIGEACCGRKGFDAAFRNMVRQALPGRALQVMPPSARLFQAPNDVRGLAVTPALMQELGAASIPPRIEGVDIDGVYAVLYSPLGMAGGWEMAPSPYARAYAPAGAIRLGENLLMHAVTH